MVEKIIRFVQKKNKTVRNNKGFSFVELIITIAVMGLLAGASVGFFSYIRFANTTKAVKAVEEAINKLQMNNMSKANAETLYIYKLSDGYYLRSGSAAAVTSAGGLSNFLSSSGQKIANSGITVSGSLSSSDVSVTGNTDGAVIKITYKRSGVFDSTTTKTNVDKLFIKGTSEHTIKLLAGSGKIKVD